MIKNVYDFWEAEELIGILGNSMNSVICIGPWWALIVLHRLHPLLLSHWPTLLSRVMKPLQCLTYQYFLCTKHMWPSELSTAILSWWTSFWLLFFLEGDTPYRQSSCVVWSSLGGAFFLSPKKKGTTTGKRKWWPIIFHQTASPPSSAHSGEIVTAQWQIIFFVSLLSL